MSRLTVAHFRSKCHFTKDFMDILFFISLMFIKPTCVLVQLKIVNRCCHCEMKIYRHTLISLNFVQDTIPSFTTFRIGQCVPSLHIKRERQTKSRTLQVKTGPPLLLVTQRLSIVPEPSAYTVPPPPILPRTTMYSIKRSRILDIVIEPFCNAYS